MQNINFRTKIKWGSIDEFIACTKQELQGKNIVLFASDSSIARLQLGDWLDYLRTNNHLTHFSQITANPTYFDIYNAILAVSGSKIDLVLALGGGSSLDTAKAVVGLLYLNERTTFQAEDILASLRTKEYLQHKQNTPIYAVPTTAGTGSEITSWATIWAPEANEKHSIDAPWLIAQKAYIVPEFTATMPSRLTLSTGLDALCQAVEAYWAKSSNPMVRVLAISSIELIVKYLPETLKELNNIFYRQKICLGSLYSGLAFANTRTTACHSISYPLTMGFDIEHGIACALTMAEVLRINLPAIEEADELLDALQIDDSLDLQNWLDRLAEGIVTMRLSSFAIGENDLETIAQLSFTQGRMDNNPVDLTVDDVKQILFRIL